METNIINQNDWRSWSLTQLATEFGIARETVQKRLSNANVRPTGTRRGHSVYGVANAARAILALDIVNETDPEKMTPAERLLYYKGNNERRRDELEAGNLVASNDARQQMAFIAKAGLQILETLPDILERDFNLDVEIISSLEKRIDELRDQWADILEGDSDG